MLCKRIARQRATFSTSIISYERMRKIGQNTYPLLLAGAVVIFFRGRRMRRGAEGGATIHGIWVEIRSCYWASDVAVEGALSGWTMRISRRAGGVR